MTTCLAIVVLLSRPPFDAPARGARLMPHVQEFAALAPANEVFKLVGPVLVKQDAAEARANVNKRLEFIASEMCVPPVHAHRPTLFSTASLACPELSTLADARACSTRVDGQIGALEKQADAARNEVRSPRSSPCAAPLTLGWEQIAQLQGTLQGPAQPQGVAAA
jgi:hypothetical protein